MKRAQPTRRLPPVKGGRRTIGTGVVPDGPLERALQREMARFGASRSLVLQSLAAFVLDVVDEQQPDHRASATRLRLVKKRA